MRIGVGIASGSSGSISSSSGRSRSRGRRRSGLQGRKFREMLTRLLESQTKSRGQEAMKKVPPTQTPEAQSKPQTPNAKPRGLEPNSIPIYT